MADLKRDLDEYLLRNDKSQTKFSIPAVFPATSVGRWFKRSGENEEAPDGWFAETQKDCCPRMGRIQRITGFCFCLGMGCLCFILAAMYTPVLLLKARKFALLYTLGSLFVISSFSFLWGPLHHLRHLCSRERLPFTSVYFGTLFATLYFALHVQSTPFTVLCAACQIVALLWFLFSYIPGGQSGIMFFTRLCSSTVSSTVSKTLPV
ncbi:uncharacterized protein LOC126143917 [Schistocerca cancellata]|uniref:uncharacterized protein LOC126143917 n=1 Tax=Schistocerca cancellata TaxID=274614 RepID=UPI002119233D|nr:uncharacterized protein LOC126143917 [Schistocerca cancellata]